MTDSIFNDFHYENGNVVIEYSNGDTLHPYTYEYDNHPNPWYISNNYLNYLHYSINNRVKRNGEQTVVYRYDEDGYVIEKSFLGSGLFIQYYHYK